MSADHRLGQRGGDRVQDPMTADRRLARGRSSDREPLDRPPVEAVVAMGANLGDRAATLAAAARELARLPLTDAVRASEPIETVAVIDGAPDAAVPGYANGIALMTTRLAPEVLLAYLHAIEERHGRVREERRDILTAGSADRTLDLDLVAYGDLVQDDPQLTLPHPRAAERVFVLAPWLSLDPDAALPGHGRVSDLLALLETSDAAASGRTSGAHHLGGPDRASGSAAGTGRP